jgi:hypothetical protein
MPFPVKYNSIFVVGLSINWFLNRRYATSYKVLKDSVVFRAIVAFFVLMACSLIYSDNWAEGLRALEPKLYLISLPLLLSGLEISASLRNLAMRVFVCSMIVAAIYSIVSTVFYYRIDFSDWSYFSWVITDTIGLSSTHYALYIVFAVLFCIVGYFEWRLFGLLPTLGMCLFFLVFLALISARMPIALFTIVLTIYAGLNIFRKTGKLRLLLVGLVLGFYVFVGVLSLTVPYLRDRIRVAVQGVEHDPRYFITIASFQILKNHWMLGVGLGDVQSSLNQQYKVIEFEEGLKNEFNPHNDWTNALLIGGVPTFLALLAVFIACVRLAVRSPDPFKWIFLLVYGLAMQTETFFNRNKGILLFTVLITLVFLKGSFVQSKDRR